MRTDIPEELTLEERGAAIAEIEFRLAEWRSRPRRNPEMGDITHLQLLTSFIDDSCPPYAPVTGNYKRYETPLASLLLTAQGWRVLGNTKWADYYEKRAKALRQRRRRVLEPKAAGFDWRKALGVESPAVIFPPITGQPAAAASTTASYF